MERVLVTYNFVSPSSAFYTSDAPYRFFGNRGVIHRDREIVKRHVGRRWIVCVTDCLGAPDTFMAPGHTTELFFVDEATAFAAGHRPCFRCRRARAAQFLELWNSVAGEDANLDALDTRLHAERLDESGDKRTFFAPAEQLPDGAMVRIEDTAYLLWQGGLHPWSPAGYGPERPPGDAALEVLTPPTTLAVLAAGFPVEVAL